MEKLEGRIGCFGFLDTLMQKRQVLIYFSVLYIFSFLKVAKVSNEAGGGFFPDLWQLRMLLISIGNEHGKSCKHRWFRAIVVYKLL